MPVVKCTNTDCGYCNCLEICEKEVLIIKVNGIGDVVCEHAEGSEGLSPEKF